MATELPMLEEYMRQEPGIIEVFGWLMTGLVVVAAVSVLLIALDEGK